MKIYNKIYATLYTLSLIKILSSTFCIEINPKCYKQEVYYSLTYSETSMTIFR